jgi:putative addiction module component (TIGR02574 family)
MKGRKIMSEAVAQIVAQLGTLSQEERAELAHAVLLTLEPEDPGAEEAWNRELARRAADIRNGQAVGIPAEQVFADWRRDRS